MKKRLLITLLVISSISCKTQTNMKIIYVYDALCGWCYGFSPVMEKFQASYSDKLEFEVLSGGMITGERIGPIGEVASYISSAYKDVENATGVTFGDEFIGQTLKNGTAIFTSIPPAIALSVFKEIDSNGRSFSFASALQRAIYFDGIAPGNINEYGCIAEQFGLNAEYFIEKMKDPKYKDMADADFEKSAKLKVSGFPTVFLLKNGKYYKIGSGYMSFSQLESNYITIKNTIK